MHHSPHSHSALKRTEAWELQRKHNVRLALVLASIVAVFFAGFMLKMLLLGS